MKKRETLEDALEIIIGKYPKFLTLIATIAFAYYIFRNQSGIGLLTFLENIGYAGTFIAGMAYSYGFTAVPATAIFLVLAKTQNILIASFIGGLGAYVSDILIFKFIRTSFQNEIECLREEWILKKISVFLPRWFKSSLTLLMAAIAIASPLPDELGVTLLAAVTTIHERVFSVLSFLLNTGGIFVVLYIGTLL